VRYFRSMLNRADCNHNQREREKMLVKYNVHWQVAREVLRPSRWPPVTYKYRPNHKTLAKIYLVTHTEKAMKILEDTKLRYSNDCSKRALFFS